MSFVVSARKYRPQNFDELVGQNHIAQTLKNALKNDKLAHAFLFSGPRGVGKTSSARILARILNCENLQDGYKACGTCSSCQSFADNASFNIFELDAASNNSVEHIRALNEQVRFQPQQGSFKIYIIDEVHMLSQAAFNAFLKTLEEPPSYAKFILATTEKHKIIPTILSRCQIFDFRRIQVPDIVSKLKAIATDEKRNIDDEALHLIAGKADGAMRDALSIYDKIISSVEGDISYKDVAENLNVLDHDFYFKIVDSALKEDFNSIMIIYDDIIKKGFEAEQFLPGLMEHLRNLLMVKDLQTAKILELSDSVIKRFEDQAQLASPSFLLSSLSILNATDVNLSRSQNKRLSVEIALSKVAYMNREIDKKKTVAPTKAPEPITNQIKSPASEPKALQDSKESITQVSKSIEVEKDIAPKVKQAAPQDKVEPVKTPEDKKQKFAPKISANLDSLIAKIEEKENIKSSSETEFSESEIEKLFKAAKEKTVSKSLETALQFSEVRIEGDIVTVLVPTQIYIDFIKQEIHLIEKIHDLYPERDIKVRFEVSEERFPDYEPQKKPKMLTTKEKYDLLVSKNPNFEKLVDTLKLKISNQ